MALKLPIPGIDMRVLSKSIMGQLKPSDMEELKYILNDCFSGKLQ